MTAGYRVAVVGATGAVGVEMLACLARRGFPASSVVALASERSAGKRLEVRGAPGGGAEARGGRRPEWAREGLVVGALSREALRGVDIALLSAGSGVSRDIAPAAKELGVCVIDNSSAFRMDPGVPLVEPEVNPGALGSTAGARNGRGWPLVIANPNCSTIILLMALTPLRRAFGVESAIVSTYQAASGAGARGVEELEAQTRADLGGEVVRAGAETGGLFHEPYAFNLFSHNAPVDGASGSNGEETKMLLETRKIWEDPRVRVSATCIRVPVRRAHSESVHVVLERGATRAEVLGALGSFAGLRVVDDRAANRFPTPLKASGQDEVLVGRVRASVVQPGEEVAEDGPAEVRDDRRAWRAWDLFVCGDQLLKGAALNAVQIAEVLVRGK